MVELAKRWRDNARELTSLERRAGAKLNALELARQDAENGTLVGTGAPAPPSGNVVS